MHAHYGNDLPVGRRYGRGDYGEFGSPRHRLPTQPPGTNFATPTGPNQQEAPRDAELIMNPAIRLVARLARRTRKAHPPQPRAR